MKHQFETPGPIDLYVETGKGRVTIHATNTAQTRVVVDGEYAADVSVTFGDNQLRVVPPKESVSWFGSRPLDVRVDLPTGSDVGVRTGSADIEVAGQVNLARLKTGSGDITCDTFTGPGLVETGSGDVAVSECLADLRAKSGSGDLSVGRCLGDLSVSTGSGDVEIGTADGRTTVKTGSGNLRVAAANGDLSLTTGSGDMAIDRAWRCRVSASGASGSVRIGIPAGTPVWADVNTVSGSIRSDLESVGAPQEGQEHLEFHARTVSGDIVLRQI